MSTQNVGSTIRHFYRS